MIIGHYNIDYASLAKIYQNLGMELALKRAS